MMEFKFNAFQESLDIIDRKYVHREVVTKNVN
jgi:hypothetical protein